jgi:hypothetical protein
MNPGITGVASSGAPAGPLDKGTVDVRAGPDAAFGS